MLTYLETTSLAIWVGESYYAYPGLLACHVVGLAIVVGIYSMRDLTLLGLVPGLNTEVFKELNKLAIVGFLINAISGLLLFSSQASYLATSVPFLSKITCIVIGMSLATVLNRQIRAAITTDGSLFLADKQTQLLAGVSLATWACAIVAGRLIAYIF